jgi:hypothetical protein
VYNIVNMKTAISALATPQLPAPAGLRSPAPKNRFGIKNFFAMPTGTCAVTYNFTLLKTPRNA